MPHHIIADVHSTVITVIDRMYFISVLPNDSDKRISNTDISRLSDMKWFVRIGVHVFYEHFFSGRFPHPLSFLKKHAHKGITIYKCVQIRSYALESRKYVRAQSFCQFFRYFRRIFPEFFRQMETWERVISKLWFFWYFDKTTQVHFQSKLRLYEIRQHFFVLI